MSKYFYAMSLLVLTCMMLSGCSDNVPLKGRVTFSDDGSPLTTGMVYLDTPTYQARGELDKNGYYVVGSLKKSDGLPAGQYRVYIVGAVEETPGGGVYSLIAPNMQSGDTSGIVLDVDRKTRKFDFTVDRNPVPRPGTKAK